MINSNKYSPGIKKSQEGFTLLEIMISLVILAAVGLAFSAYFMNGIEVVQQSNNRNQALNTAQNQINQSILNNEGSTETITIIFNEDQSEETILNIEGQLININQPYTSTNNNTNDITLQYFEVVVP